MTNRFEQVVDRDGLDSVKLEGTPDHIKLSGHLTMWGAEFDFPTATFVSDAISEWAKRGIYPYTVETRTFRELVSNWMRRRRGWDIEPEWVVSTLGISYSLAVAVRAFTEPGDCVVSLDPGYDNYWTAILKCGRCRVGSKMIYNGLSYSIDWEDLESKMAMPECKMLAFCNPHNPTGKVYDEIDIQMIAELAVKHDVIIFSDEIFAECMYDKMQINTFNQINANVKAISATSLGKWLSFTGTNQANMIIPNEGIRLQFKEELQRTFCGSINPMMIPAYNVAYSNQGEEWLEEFMQYINGNLEVAEEYINSLPGFHTVKPQGTYILWVDASEFCSNEKQLQEFLIEKAYFHVDMSKQYYGEPGFFRMNLAMPRTELLRNLKSLESAVRDVAALWEAGDE